MVAVPIALVRLVLLNERYDEDMRRDCSPSWGCRGKTPDESQIRETTCSCFLSSPTKSAHVRPIGVGCVVNRTDLRLVGYV